jgi:antitoxin (DNA-binding transcriptional repressor) of toxin-antitoxin stability system
VTAGEAVLLAAGGVAVLALVPRPARPRPRAIGVRSNANWRRRRPLRRWRARTASDLAAIERLLSLSVASADDEHTRLRPLVTDIARQRLADHTGVRLDGDPEAAAAAIGPEVWELARPDRPGPQNRRARGIPPARLRRVVESLERIGEPG